MLRHAIRPRSMSLFDFIVAGVLNENDVNEDGHVDEEVRKNAEKEYHKKKRRQRPQSAGSQRQTENEVLKCTICFTENRSHAFVPCFHFYTCQNCSSQVSQCPICRKEVIWTQRIWY